MKSLVSVSAAALLLTGATFAAAQDVKDGTVDPPRSQTDIQQDSAPVESGANLPEAQPSLPEGDDPNSMDEKLGQDLSTDDGSAATGAGSGEESPSPSTEFPAKNPADQQIDTQKSDQ